MTASVYETKYLPKPDVVPVVFYVKSCENGWVFLFCFLYIALNILFVLKELANIESP